MKTDRAYLGQMMRKPMLEKMGQRVSLPAIARWVALAAAAGVVGYHLISPTTYSECAQALNQLGHQALPQLPLSHCAPQNEADHTAVQPLPV